MLFLTLFPRASLVRHGLCVIALGAITLPAFAGSASVTAPQLTLEAATQQAVAMAPLLEARRAQTEAARQDAVRAGRLPDPEITVGIDNLAIQGPGAYTAGGDSMTMRTVGIRQAIPSRSQRQAERELGRANTAVAATMEASSGLTIEQQVAQAWIAAWGAHQQATMLQTLRQAWSDEASIAQARLRSGTGTAADVLALRMEALDLDNRLDETAAQEAQARARLIRWLGQTGNQPLADAPDFARLPVDEPGLLASVDRQGELLAWPAREQAADAALAVAQAQKHPAWSVGASYGARARGLSDMVSLQVGVSLPLFTRNRQDRAIAARVADRDAVLAGHDDARRQQVEAIQAAWAQWQALGAQVRRHRETLLPLASDRVTLALAGYRGGGDIQPLLAARRDEIAHHTDYARLLADYGRAWAALAYLLPHGSTP